MLSVTECVSVIQLYARMHNTHTYTCTNTLIHTHMHTCMHTDTNDYTTKMLLVI